MTNKTLAHYVLTDKRDNPLRNILYKVIDGNGKPIVEGFTNSKGETYKLSRNKGSVVHLYVKINVAGYQHVDTTYLASSSMEIREKFSGVVIDFLLEKHKGDKGEYKRKTHKVKSGETLSSIASKYGTTAKAIAKLNNIKDPDKISIGKILKVPPKTSSSSSSSSSSNSQKPKPQKLTGTYTVKKGDTLAKIAQRADKTTVELQRANNISNPDHIQVGQKIIISNESSPNTKPSIAKKPQSKPIQVKKNSKRSSQTGSPKTVISNDGGCDCQTYNLIWGSKVSCEFRRKVIKISQDLWPDNYLKMANSLMAVFAWESGGTFKSDAPNRGNSGGTGLIQFMPPTYTDLTGKTANIERVYNYWGRKKNLKRVKQLADMTEVEQLDLVHKYFKPKKGKKLEFIDFYLQVLFPVSSGKPEHVVFANHISKLDRKHESKKIQRLRVRAFKQNNMDKNNDGKVMKSEIARSIQHYIDDGKKYTRVNCSNTILKPPTKPKVKSNIVEINIHRTYDTTKATMSTVSIPSLGFNCYCLERPGPDTTTSGMRLRIPIGTYKVKWRESSKNKSLGKAFVLFNSNVAASRLILIHIGNYPDDSDGCLLFGSTQSRNFVGNSTNTIYKFYKLFEKIDAKRIRINITQDYK